MTAAFVAPGRIVTGLGCLASVGEEAARLGGKALLVTGRRFARETGLTERVLTLLREAGVASSVYDQVTPDPTLEQVEAARRQAREGGCDLVLGLGGGSVMDAAKVVAGLAREAAPAREFQQGRAVQRQGLPFIAVPTTAGTGAEATPNGVITDTERRAKQSIRDPSFMPAAAIVDPEPMRHADLTVTAHAGMDALDQAVESHVSRHAYSLTRALSRQAVALLSRALPRLAEDLGDMAAREDAAMGSLMAGIALANAKLGVVHGLAHPLGARYGIPHGRVCGILMPHAIRYNAEVAAEGYAELSEVVGRPLVDFVEETLTRFRMPSDLGEYHIPRADIPAIVAQALGAGSTHANPRDVTEGDLTALLETAI